MEANTYVRYVKQPLTKRSKKILKWLLAIFVVLLILCFLLGFVAVPYIFKGSLGFQRLVIFSNSFLTEDKAYFDKHQIYPGLRNFHVSVRDENKSPLKLGVWHILPKVLVNISITDLHFDYEYALSNSNVSVLLYFHGAGETRGTSSDKFDVLRTLFHVIAFDYRSFGDSGEGDLFEDTVISDCIQLYRWVKNATNAPIFIWGHSLGSALAARTAAELHKNGTEIPGLILEAPFPSMADELPVHPYGKIFAWLPWFHNSILQPLQDNGFIFNTGKHVQQVKCPIMIFNSEDDSIVPHRLGFEVFKLANESRSEKNITFYYNFPAVFRYDHNFIYEDPFILYFINYFIAFCAERIRVNVTLGSHEG